MKESLRVLLIVTGLQNASENLKQFSRPTEKQKNSTPAESDNYPVEDTLWDTNLYNRGQKDERVRPEPAEKVLEESRETERPGAERVPRKSVPTPVTEFEEKKNIPENELMPEDEMAARPLVTEPPVAPPVPVAREPRKSKNENGEGNIFDIRESRQIKDSQKNSNHEQRNKRVFTEIFEEEAQGDLNILVEAIVQLEKGNTDLKVIKDIRSACNSLKNTAQLFTFEKIEQLTESVANFMDFLLKQKSFSTELVHKVIDETPDIIHELMYDDNEAEPRVDEIQQKILTAQQNISGREAHGADGTVPQNENGDPKKKVKNSFFSPKIEDTNFETSKMNETAQHVKKLFS
jgi:hypothetical protein